MSMAPLQNPLRALVQALAAQNGSIAVPQSFTVSLTSLSNASGTVVTSAYIT